MNARTRKPRSSIESHGVKDLVEDLLEVNTTYDEIQKTVEAQTGQHLSTAALSRYRTKWSAAEARLAQAGREAEAITKVLLDHPGSHLADAGMGLLLGKLVQRFASAEESFETSDLLELGHLLVKATRAYQLGESVELQKERLDLMKQKVAATADKARDVMTEAGVPQEKVVELVDDILGVTA